MMHCDSVHAAHSQHALDNVAGFILMPFTSEFHHAGFCRSNIWRSNRRPIQSHDFGGGGANVKGQNFKNKKNQEQLSLSAELRSGFRSQYLLGA